MKAHISHLMSLAMGYIQKGDLNGAERLLKQALKMAPKNSEILRLIGIIYAFRAEYHDALKLFDSSLRANPNNFLSHSNRGNVLRDLKRYDLAIKSYDKAIALQPDYSEVYNNKANLLQTLGEFDVAIEYYNKAVLLQPNYAEAHSNLGNAYLKKMEFDNAILCCERAISLDPKNAEFYCNLGNAYQEKSQFDNAILSYENAISLDPKNPDFYCNLGNAFWKLNQLESAKMSYEKSVSIAPEHANAQHNLSHLELYGFNFSSGWERYEYRWLTENKDSPLSIVTSKPKWDGASKPGRLFIWSEQGIGDQILYGSMLRDLESYPQSKIVSVNNKLIPVFQRCFPSVEIIDKDLPISDDLYDEQISLGSLGKFLRPDKKSFGTGGASYLTSRNMNQTNYKLNENQGLINCGISWKSGRTKLGSTKSISLIEMAPILKIQGVSFINLQYGDVSGEICSVNEQIKTSIQVVEEVDLFDDIEGILDVIGSCNIVVTTSNSTAHLAGAIGKETLLLLPCGNSRFWYWHDIDGISLWYPSIRVFKQERQGDWSEPIQAVKAYLGNRFGV